MYERIVYTSRAYSASLSTGLQLLANIFAEWRHLFVWRYGPAIAGYSLHASLALLELVLPLVFLIKVTVSQLVAIFGPPQPGTTMHLAYNFEPPPGLIIVLCWLLVLSAFRTWKYWAYYVHMPFAYLFSWVLRTDTATRPPARFDPDHLRSTFNSTPMPQATKQKNHTHPWSAADRNAFSLFAERLARSLGLIPYFYQMSASDQRKGRSGSRKYYWAKDLLSEEEPFNPPPNALLVLVDVDYYVDMPAFLNEHHYPVLLYTLQPQAVAAEFDEVSYYFNRDNSLTYHVTGSGVYSHAVWNYQHDAFMANVYAFPGFLSRMFSYAFGHAPTIAQASIHCDRKGMGQHHECILLTPTRWWNNVFRMRPAEYQAADLRRYEVVDGDFTRMRVKREKHMMMSTGRPGELNAALMPVFEDDAIASLARTTGSLIKAGLNFGQVQQFFHGKDEQAAAAILYEYHLLRSPKFFLTSFPVEEAIRNYQYANEHGYNFTAKHGMHQFMNPFFVDAACVADVTAGNERAGVQLRVIDAQSNVTAGPFLLNAIETYLQIFLPKELMQKLVPVTDEEVYERQDTARQRAQLDKNHGLWRGKRVLKVFGKKETHEKVTPERIITTYNSKDKQEYAKFIYALSDYVCKFPWYAFSKTPLQVAESVVAVCRRADFVCNTDFSKFDGHVSPVLRELERQLLARAFHPDYAARLTDLHNAQYDLDAYGAMGTTYHLGSGRGSGSMETSVFNTIAGHFFQYLACISTRESSKPSAFTDPMSAFYNASLHGGDDGLVANIPEASLRRAAELIGQKLTVQIVERGSLGVKFLARIYGPRVWYGDPTSMCDLRRQLVKFHTTVVHPDAVTPKQKLLEKARSYWLTDRNTPIIGDFCIRALELSGRPQALEETALPVGDQAWLPDPLSQYVRFGTETNDLSVQYPNSRADWMNTIVLQQFPYAAFGPWDTWLQSTCDSVDQLLQMPPVGWFPTAPRPSDPPNVLVSGVITNPTAEAKAAPQKDDTKAKPSNRSRPQFEKKGKPAEKRGPPPNPKNQKRQESASDETNNSSPAAHFGKAPKRGRTPDRNGRAHGEAKSRGPPRMTDRQILDAIDAAFAGGVGNGQPPATRGG